MVPGMNFEKEIIIRMSALYFQGDEFILFLQQDYLPKMNVSPELCQEFCQALKSDGKMFRSYYKVPHTSLILLWLNLTFSLSMISS